MPELLVTGGGAKAPFVRQLQADIYGKPVVPVEQEEGPAFGAALLAAVGAGAFPDVPSATKATLRRKPAQQPNSDAHAAYEAPYRMYRKLYGGIKAARGRRRRSTSPLARLPSPPRLRAEESSGGARKGPATHSLRLPLLHVRVEERGHGRRFGTPLVHNRASDFASDFSSRCRSLCAPTRATVSPT